VSAWLSKGFPNINGAQKHSIRPWTAHSSIKEQVVYKWLVQSPRLCRTTTKFDSMREKDNVWNRPWVKKDPTNAPPTLEATQRDDSSVGVRMDSEGK